VVAVIVDLLVAAGLSVWNFAVGLLPTGHLDLPGASGLADVLGGVDSLIPIRGPLLLALGVLSAVVVFVVVRVVLIVINIVLP
jgi:hypothetical protein